MEVFYSQKEYVQQFAPKVDTLAFQLLQVTYSI